MKRKKNAIVPNNSWLLQDNIKPECEHFWLMSLLLLLPLLWLPTVICPWAWGKEEKKWKERRKKKVRWNWPKNGISLCARFSWVSFALCVLIPSFFVSFKSNICCPFHRYTYTHTNIRSIDYLIHSSLPVELSRTVWTFPLLVWIHSYILALQCAFHDHQNSLYLRISRQLPLNSRPYTVHTQQRQILLLVFIHILAVYSYKRINRILYIY